MATDKQWDDFEAALHEEFRSHGQDPTNNYDVDRKGMTVRIPHFGSDLSEKLRFDVAENDLRQPVAFAASVYAAAHRAD